MKSVLLLLFLILAATVAGAETRYIIDSLEVPVRTGRSLEHRILELATSGTPLEVLEKTDDGYARVRTPQGAEGWILVRYLTDQPSANRRLEALRGEFSKLQREREQLKQQFADLGAYVKTLEQKDLVLQEQNRDLSQQLESLRQTAAQPLEISERNEALQQELERDRASLQVLLRENAKLRDHSQRDWFMVGAIVTAGGVLLGLIISRLSGRRRRGWGEL